MTAAVARQRISSRQSTGAGRSGGATKARTAPSRSVSARVSAVRPHLKVLDQQAIRRRARRRNLGIALFLVVIIGFFAAALAQAQLVANQHELDLLRNQIAEAEAKRARLERQVEESSAPSAIINRAQEIGMVRANDPIYLAATTSVPAITPISTIGSATATTEALKGLEIAVNSTSRLADASVDSLMAAPVAVSPVASIAGTRAVAAGVDTG